MWLVTTWLLCCGTFVLGCWWAGRNRPTVDEAMQLHDALALQTALRGMAETSNARLREAHAALDAKHGLALAELQRLAPAPVQYVVTIEGSTHDEDRLRGEAARSLETQQFTP